MPSDEDEMEEEYEKEAKAMVKGIKAAQGVRQGNVSGTLLHAAVHLPVQDGGCLGLK